MEVLSYNTTPQEQEWGQWKNTWSRFCKSNRILPAEKGEMPSRIMGTGIHEDRHEGEDTVKFVLSVCLKELGGSYS